MNILEESKPLLTAVEQRLMAVVRPEMPSNLKDPIQYFLETPSKKIRPLLTLYACQMVGGRVEDALPAAAAVELFHDFTLIHDDIMDQDELRRGRPTIHVRWDASTAILVGDALIGLAFQELMQSPPDHLMEVTRIFSEALVKVCEGQGLDKAFESRPRVSLEEYLEMIHKKTAWLIQVSCHLGALIGGGSHEQIEALKTFGYQIGMGFQIQDDLLDVVADPDKLGKKVGSDFLMHKKTYLTIRYDEFLEAHPEWQQRLPARSTQFTQFEAFRKALEDLGILDSTRRVVDTYLQEGLRALETVCPLSPDNPLYRLTRFLAQRDY
ncbi:MAG: polyprenyl synthetase family protein [Calditrichaeota bacterium]|nr:polyprenyl synthetase family protein [Calditrichota bacterium]